MGATQQNWATVFNATHWSSSRESEERLWLTSNLALAEDLTGLLCCSFQQRKGTWGYNSHELIKTGPQKVGKILPGVFACQCLLKHSNGMVTVWHKQHENMFPFLAPQLSTTAYHSITVHHSFVTTAYPPSTRLTGSSVICKTNLLKGINKEETRQITAEDLFVESNII